MTATRCFKSVLPRGFPCDPRLVQRRERDAAIEHTKTVALDLRRTQSDTAGDPMAIALERGEVLVTILVEVHRHAVDDGVEVLARQRITADDFGKRQRDGMLGRSLEDGGDFAAPPGELHPRD